MTTYRCPACITADSVRRSKVRRWEEPLGLLGIFPFRCKACAKRFHRRWNIPLKARVEMDAAALLASFKNTSPMKMGLENTSQAGVLPSLSTNEFPMCVVTARAANRLQASSASQQTARRWAQIAPAVSYAFKSFIALLLLHFLIGYLEYGPLGQAAMWVNLLTLITMVGAVLVFIHLEQGQRSFFQAFFAAAVLVLWWECFFLMSEVVYGLMLGPGGRGLQSDVALYRQQAPWIWMTYAALPVAGALGWLAYFVWEQRKLAGRTG